MNENTSTTAPKVFEIIDGNTLMAQEYEPLQFAVEKILPHGVFILAGSGKIGKSWLSLDLCVNVATGGKLWEFFSEKGDVLYLALEDNHPRLQHRLNKIKAAAVDIARLKLTTASFGISSGLIEQAHNLYLSACRAPVQSRWRLLCGVLNCIQARSALSGLNHRHNSRIRLSVCPCCCKRGEYTAYPQVGAVQQAA